MTFEGGYEITLMHLFEGVIGVALIAGVSILGYEGVRRMRAKRRRAGGDAPAADKKG